MNINQLTIGIITTILAVVLSVTVLIPIVDSSTTTTTVYDNSDVTFNTLDYSDSAKSHTIAITNYTITVDGEVFTPTDSFTQVIFTDTFLITTSKSGGYTVGVAGYGENGVETLSAVYNSATSSLTCVTSGGTATLTAETDGTETTATFDYTWEYVIAEDGDYAFLYSSDEAPVYATSVNDLTMQRTISTSYIVYHDGVEMVNGTEATSPAITFDTTQVVEDEVYTYGAASIASGGGVTVNRYIAPVEVVYTEDNEGAVYDLVKILPLLILTGLVLGVVGMFVSRQD